MQKTTILALLLACGTAQAAEWIIASRFVNGKGIVYVDVSSIKDAGEIRRAWVKIVLTPKTQKGWGQNAGKWVSEMLSRDAFNCRQETYFEEAQTQYFLDGSIWTAPPDTEATTSWLPIPPETIIAAEKDLVCGWLLR